MKTLQFHPEAREEYLSAANHYENRSPGLGARFSVEIEATLEQIREAPLRWSILEADVRRCVAHIFPYGILYTVEQSSILVLAVMHCSRKPGYWKERRDR